MSETKRSWGTGMLVYAMYRRTLRKVGGKHGNPARTLLLRVVLVMLVMPLAGPILWHALWTMPTALVVFVGSAVALRMVRWFWRRSR